jgi:hypothetical protein
MTQPVRIAAGTVFYSTETVLMEAMWNLVAQGVTDFFLLCHDSLPTTGDFAQFAGVANIRLAYKRTDPFLQGRMMTSLAEAAKRSGFDVFIPFDSDEFPASSADTSPLREQVEAWVSAGESAALAIDYRNYLLPNRVEEFSADKLRLANQTARPTKVKNYTNPSVGSSSVEIVSDTKIWVNLRLIPEYNRFSITEGSHALYIDGQLQKPIRAEGLRMGHLPYAGYQNLIKSKAHASRLQAAGFDKSVGALKYQLCGRDEATVLALWREKSWIEVDGKIRSANPELETEFSYGDDLERAADRIASAREATAKRKAPTQPASDFSKSDPEFLQLLLDIAIDSDTGFPSRASLVWQLRAAGAQRDMLQKLLAEKAPHLGVTAARRNRLQSLILKIAKRAFGGRT